MIGRTILHFKIADKIGEGGMGLVYLAEDLNLERKVAIKFLPHHISANEEERNRFKIEAKAAAALNHPNIATIHAIEEYDGQMFIVMEYIDGVELKNKIVKALPAVKESLDIVEKIAEGLRAAHQKGIIHRDIKSSNIMITSSGQIKIMDFGLAKIRGVSNVTKLGTTLGTASYMSPEQARGEHIDVRTDIWSLGVIFYEMLTGSLPFKGDFEQAIIYSILNEEPKSIVSIKEDLPMRLEHLINKMLAKKPELRYRNIEEFLAELREVKNKEESKKEIFEKTIAVLPFENISPDKDADYFADGLTEELIINLSRIKEVNVIARVNTIQYKETKKDIKTIGRELGVRYVMVGSVRKFKDDLRISVQLIEVLKGMQLWGETYKGTLADVLIYRKKYRRKLSIP
ncbi:MAG TPA: serine/threonine-protein kinase [Ignavibacteriaceae bacterium]|nr:serine/threonine-protein kinase [Ignavibacteriaceae bacterium]